MSLDHHLRQAEADLQLARGSVERAAQHSSHPRYLGLVSSIMLTLEGLLAQIRHEHARAEPLRIEPERGRDIPPGSSNR